MLDFSAGSNTTGAAAESLGRRWLAFDLSAEYLATSVFRFADARFSDEEAVETYRALSSDPGAWLKLQKVQRTLALG